MFGGHGQRIRKHCRGQVWYNKSSWSSKPYSVALEGGGWSDFLASRPIRIITRERLGLCARRQIGNLVRESYQLGLCASRLIGFCVESYRLGLCARSVELIANATWTSSKDLIASRPKELSRESNQLGLCARKPTGSSFVGGWVDFT